MIDRAEEARSGAGELREEGNLRAIRGAGAGVGERTGRLANRRGLVIALLLGAMAGAGWVTDGLGGSTLAAQARGLGPTAPSGAPSGASSRSPSAAGADTALATPVPPVDWPEIPDLEGRAPACETRHFAVYSSDDEWALGSELARRWGAELESILGFVGLRIGTELPVSPVLVAFAPSYAARCPARGIASMGAEPIIVVYADESTPDEQIRGVLAHEIVHQLTVNERFVGDGVLTEGLANWGADELMLAWQGYESWDAAVVDYLERGVYASLADEESLSPRAREDCLERRDRVYNTRAAFVGWLVETIGLETVLSMPYVELAQRDPVSGELQFDEETGEVSTSRRPDYRAATGYDLETLELIWLVSLWSTR